MKRVQRFVYQACVPRFTLQCGKCAGTAHDAVNLQGPSAGVLSKSV